ncbi:MAG: hypothetical protein KIS63_21635, partial [Caldilineales bacterium]|nr:hypothetical protein [Caldilineales bacterium]
GQTPELKQVVLSGSLNASQCPNCRNVNYLASPFLYHDPAHEFLGVFIPTQLNISEAQRQKVIGDLSKALMDSLPAEQRRYYMVSPQQFLTMDSLLEKLLGFEGVTPDMLAASRKKVELVSELARLKDDAIAFSLTVKENERYLDQEFFSILANLTLTAQNEGATQQAELITDLREKLLPLTEIGRRMLKQRRAVQGLGASPTRESIMAALLAADEDEAEAIAVVARPIMDYQFFQDYTNHIESAPADRRPALEANRQRMLQVLESMRAADQSVAQASTQVLQELLGAENLEQAVQEMLPYIDQAVMGLLAANIEEAEKRGAKAAATRLKQVWDAIVTAMDAALPPEMRLLYALTDADYPDGTRAILKENKEHITPEFLALLQSAIDATEKDAADNSEQQDVVRHLRNVLTQARLGV